MTDNINNVKTGAFPHTPSTGQESAPVDTSVQDVAQRALTEAPTDGLGDIEVITESEVAEAAGYVNFSNLDGSTHSAANHGFWQSLKERIVRPQATNLAEALHTLSRAALPSLFLRVPTDCSEFTWATSLDLSNNGLTVVPNGIGELAHLVTLDLSHNNFKDSFPESICNSKTLTNLNLSNCQLKTLPDSFGDLESLTELDLSGNRLNSLPESFSKLTNLKTIYINSREKALEEAIKKTLPDCRIVTK